MPATTVPSEAPASVVPDPAPITGRGTTTVPASVVARVAERAASEVPHVGSAAGGVLGIGSRRDFDGAPSVECDLYGRSAVLRLDAGIGFPVPLADALAALREHVAARVEQLCGVQVARIDVKVSWLHPSDPARRLL